MRSQHSGRAYLIRCLLAGFISPTMSMGWPSTRSPRMEGEVATLGRSGFMFSVWWHIAVTSAQPQRCTDYIPLNRRICNEIRYDRYLLLPHRDISVKQGTYNSCQKKEVSYTLFEPKRCFFKLVWLLFFKATSKYSAIV